MTCTHCQGRGFLYVEPGSSQRYRCTDCGGTGRAPECDQRDPFDDSDDGEREDSP